jgi:hypothetical protein
VRGVLEAGMLDEVIEISKNDIIAKRGEHLSMTIQNNVGGAPVGIHK